MTKVTVYTCVSNYVQIDDDTLEIQQNELINYISLNYNDYVVFEDGGYSGDNTLRPKYQKMLFRLQECEFIYLLVWKIDRVSRNILDFSDLYTEFQSLDVTFISKMEQYDTFTIIGQTFLKIYIIIAELEQHYASERVNAVLYPKVGNISILFKV